MKPPPSLIPIPTKTLVRAIYWTALAAVVVALTAWWLASHHAKGANHLEAKGRTPVKSSDGQSWHLKVAGDSPSPSQAHTPSDELDD
jgi:hypothetical protein